MEHNKYFFIFWALVVLCVTGLLFCVLQSYTEYTSKIVSIDRHEYIITLDGENKSKIYRKKDIVKKKD